MATIQELHDNKKRIEIPIDILRSCSFLNVVEKIAFYLDKNLGTVFLSSTIFKFPSGSHFLGYCDYDETIHCIYLPENVECALGHSQEYYFASDAHEDSDRLYIYTVKS